MTFYGPENRDDLRRVYELVDEIGSIYEKSDRLRFIGDNMIVLMRNMAFARDAAFMAAFNDNLPEKADEFKIWRLHTYCWAGRSALNLPGDFVECGVFHGFYSAVLVQYLDFAAIDKRMYLFDTFAGLSEEYSTDRERRGIADAYDLDESWVEGVRKRFAPYPNVVVRKGVVPDVLLEGSPKRVAFLHLDMNAGAAEIGALEVLFERMTPGGIVLMDDFGRVENRELHLLLLQWMEGHGHPVLELPTGQGLVIKRN